MDSEEYADKIKTAEDECSQIFRQIKQYEQLLNEEKEKYSQAQKYLNSLRKKQHQKNSIKVISDSTNSTIETWQSKEFPWTKLAQEKLKSVFNLDQFRPVQVAAINAAMQKKDTILVLPTGAGKSLIFQLTGIIDSGITLVVSPLISLMDDQVMNMRKYKLEARALHSNLSKSEIKSIKTNLESDHCTFKFLYLSPEWLAKSKSFMHTLMSQRKKINRVVIDEVHCCSSWGHDFRPDYKYLGILRKTLSNVPFLCLTATATASVLVDVMGILNLSQPVIMTQSINRPNLFYKVQRRPMPKSALVEFLSDYINEKHEDESGIIYANTVNECTSLFEDLKEKGIRVGIYYANMEHDHKEKFHRKWMEDKIRVIVATNAFGMGIDKSNVRFVIHVGMPRSIENMYQESGRAGRDGKAADCLILYSLSDYMKLYGNATSISESKKNTSVLMYCTNQRHCRRALLNAAFKDNTSTVMMCNNKCDNCCRQGPLFSYNIAPVLENVRALLHHMRAVGENENVTLKQLLDAYYKKGPVKCRLDSLHKPKFDPSHAELVLAHLISRRYLTLERGFTPYSVNCYIKVTRKKSPNGIVIHSRKIMNGLDQIDIQQFRARDSQASLDILDRMSDESESDNAEELSDDENETEKSSSATNKKRKISTS